jgi:hypothetical protein
MRVTAHFPLNSFMIVMSFLERAQLTRESPIAAFVPIDFGVVGLHKCGEKRYSAARDFYRAEMVGMF